MGADPDKRIHKLPRRLKAVKTVVTVITETDFVACHEDVGAMKQNHCSVPGNTEGHCIIQQTISILWGKSNFVKLHL